MVCLCVCVLACLGLFWRFFFIEVFEGRAGFDRPVLVAYHPLATGFVVFQRKSKITRSPRTPFAKPLAGKHLQLPTNFPSEAILVSYIEK